jgi:hypothetical protein
MLILIQATAEATVTNAGQLADFMKYAGFGLWTLAYLLFIVRGINDKTYGVPLISVCLNFTWELYFTAKCPYSGERKAELCTATGMDWWGLVLWLVLDFVILIQLIVYGSKSEPTLLSHLPARGRRPIFNVFLAVSLSIALYWQYAFVNLFTDRDGNSLAWLTNFIMAWLFVSSAFFRRPDARGLSLYGGLLMLAGNCGFAAYAYLTGFVEFSAWPKEFTAALMVGVILVNVLYLDVLRYKPRGAELPAPRIVLRAPWRSLVTST